MLIRFGGDKISDIDYKYKPNDLGIAFQYPTFNYINNEFDQFQKDICFDKVNYGLYKRGHSKIVRLKCDQEFEYSTLNYTFDFKKEEDIIENEYKYLHKYLIVVQNNNYFKSPSIVEMDINFDSDYGWYVGVDSGPKIHIPNLDRFLL